jgi:hypothetical protein
VCVGGLRSSDVGLRMGNVVVCSRQETKLPGANGRDYFTGGSGGDLFAATTTGKARGGKAIATLSAQPRMTCQN